ncbi:MAG: Rieske (2Fe-2S) protein [Acidobacteria bacterium]|nr:Rieske (2Fe-2S) protein [Acidobacteriota bacterium]MBK8149625.1 Rieske (2Fe-2S) protein [Acidobacteriota bacterium]MBK8809746.1 Rieske (2Fe-2S) protein [Acidobacteriota bacterium]
MNSKLQNAIGKVLSDERDVREANRSHQREFPFDRDKESQVTRREFCNFLGLTSTAFLVGTAGFALKAVYDRENVSQFAAQKIEGGATLERNSAINFRYPTASDPAILIRSANGELNAFDQKCTHLLCPVYYDKQAEKIECPCHEAGFDAKTGNVLYGPPPRPLNRILIEEKDGEIWAIGVVTGGVKNERS